MFSDHQLEYLVQQWGANHLLLGSDYPYDMATPDPVGHVLGAKKITRADKVKILGGNGDDTIGLAGVQVGKDRLTPTAAFPSSTTTIDGGAGNDVIGVHQSVVRDLKVLSGSGDDTVSYQDLTIRGTANVDLGNGNDRFAFGAKSSLNDNVTVLGGAGDDQLLIADSITLAAGKKIAINGGTETNLVENDSTIPISAFNPAPVNWPIGIVDGAAIEKAIISALQTCFQK